MTSIHETAYPRFKQELTSRDLHDIYTPTAEELKFVKGITRRAPAKLYLIILLKTVQRLGYFPMLAEIPPVIIAFLNKKLDLRIIPMRDLLAEEKSDFRQRSMEAIRSYLNIKPISSETSAATEQAATLAAQTKQELADIINVIIEELIRQRFELPAFSTLNRSAQRIRNQVNERYFRSLTDALSPQIIDQFDTMLIVAPDQTFSGWQQLKQEPKKPTNSEVRQYLDHVAWLKTYSVDLPEVTHIPVVKRNQYMHEARALEAGDLRNTQKNKRYALMVILFHTQLSRVLDDAVEMFVRKLRKLHSGAEEKLQQYYL